METIIRSQIAFFDLTSTAHTQKRSSTITCCCHAHDVKVLQLGRATQSRLESGTCRHQCGYFLQFHRKTIRLNLKKSWKGGRGGYISCIPSVSFLFWSYWFPWLIKALKSQLGECGMAIGGCGLFASITLITCPGFQLSLAERYIY